MLSVANVPLSLDDALRVPPLQWTDEPALVAAVSKTSHLPASAIVRAQITRRAVDARKKTNVHFVCSVAVETNDTAAEQRCIEDGRARPWHPYEPLEIASYEKREGRVVVVGTGPAGLFAALYLARAGARPLVVERGANVVERAAIVQAFNEGAPLDPAVNVQFGEGGAGTFSDGKLTTNNKNPLAAHVLRWFVDAGAPQQILWEAKPHIGSDRLPAVVQAMRDEIIARGGRVCFNTQMVGMVMQQGHIHAVQLRDSRDDSADIQTVEAAAVVLACGHSARDTLKMLCDAGFVLEQKPFSMGVRIEHAQSAVNRAQWGSAAQHPALGAADYKMAVHLPDGRSAYTFCMCPGGTVVAAASESEGVVVNGMSNFARDGQNANAAVLVNVDPVDFGSPHPLAGCALQQQVEQAAFRAACNAGAPAYAAPAQTVGDFLAASAQAGSKHQGRNTQADTPAVQPTYPRGIAPCNLHEVLPRFVADALAEALPLFDAKLHGFSAPEALMTAPETRSSSPVRIVRDGSLQAKRSAQAGIEIDCGIYPCGEGAGYAGGIMSAAIDGLRVAGAICKTSE